MPKRTKKTEPQIDMDALKEATSKVISESGDAELIRGALEVRDRHAAIAAQRITELMHENAALKAALDAKSATVCPEDDHVCPDVLIENYERLRAHQVAKIRGLEADLVKAQ